jgi:transcriptional regulator with XRE-family HTH domain
VIANLHRPPDSAPAAGPNPAAIDDCARVLLDAGCGPPGHDVAAFIRAYNTFADHLARGLGGEILGRVFKHARLAADLTQREAGERLGPIVAKNPDDAPKIVNSYFSKLEVRANPTLKRFAALGLVYALPPSALVSVASAFAVRFGVQPGDSPDEVQWLERALVAVGAAVKRWASEAADGAGHRRRAIERWVQPGGEPAALPEQFCRAVGLTLAGLRVVAGMKQADAAVALTKALEPHPEGERPATVTVAYISQLELGYSIPSLPRLALLTQLYRATLPALFRAAEGQMVPNPEPLPAEEQFRLFNELTRKYRLQSLSDLGVLLSDLQAAAGEGGAR